MWSEGVAGKCAGLGGGLVLLVAVRAAVVAVAVHWLGAARRRRHPGVPLPARALHGKPRIKSHALALEIVTLLKDLICD